MNKESFQKRDYNRRILLPSKYFLKWYAKMLTNLPPLRVYAFHEYYSPSGIGSIHWLFRLTGAEFISASLWACFCSRLSFCKALCIIAAWDREPSGFYKQNKLCYYSTNPDLVNLMLNNELTYRRTHMSGHFCTKFTKQAFGEFHKWNKHVYKILSITQLFLISLFSTDVKDD